jgi:hypothetical protein
MPAGHFVSELLSAPKLSDIFFVISKAMFEA